MKTAKLLLAIALLHTVAPGQAETERDGMYITEAFLFLDIDARSGANREDIKDKLVTWMIGNTHLKNGILPAYFSREVPPEWVEGNQNKMLQVRFECYGIDSGKKIMFHADNIETIRSDTNDSTNGDVRIQLPGRLDLICSKALRRWDKPRLNDSWFSKKTLIAGGTGLFVGATGIFAAYPHIFPEGECGWDISLPWN